MKKITKICPICSIQFEVPQCHQHRYITCGYKCGGIYRKKTIIENICKFCSSKFISKKQPTKPQDFCCRTCALKSRNNKIKRICIECGNSFEISVHKTKKSVNHGKFCNNACRISKWNRDSLAAQKPGCYRKNAWKTYEKKCYDCGNIDERVLVIHHIDGNRKNGNIENLIPVCHNCHCIRHIILSGNHRIPSYRGQD